MTFEEQYEPTDIQDYLAHYGRKGMKWYEHIFGRYQSNSKYAKKGGSVKNTISNISNKRQKQNVKKLSSEEIKNRIDRMRLEKEYLDLSKDTRSKGKKAVDKILESVGDASLNIVKRSVENIGQQYITYWLGSKINLKAGSDVVNPKKGQKDK